MTAIPADMFAVASSRSRRVGRVLEALLGTLWRMKLTRTNFRDAEVSDKDKQVFARDSEDRREFYRVIAQGRWAIRDPKDRRIADALAEGGSYRDIMRKERVGQYRIERVLFTLVQGRNPPWHWRTGKPREKAGQKKRQSVERKWRRRRSASTKP